MSFCWIFFAELFNFEQMNYKWKWLLYTELLSNQTDKLWEYQFMLSFLYQASAIFSFNIHLILSKMRLWYFSSY